MMRSFFIACLTMLCMSNVSIAIAAGSSVPLQKASIKPEDKSSLQRGARNFMDYCSGCHSLSLVSYHQIAMGIGLLDSKEHKDIFKRHLIFPRNKDGEKIKYGEKVVAGFSDDYGAQVFGTKVPDLSLITRVRGQDWLYSYLISYYEDSSKPTGYNNHVFHDVAMPNPFWELQGTQHYNEEEGTFELVKPGLLSEPEFKRFVLDTVNFLSFVSDPSKKERESVGLWVVLFFLFFSFVTYFLHRSFWADVESGKQS